MNEKTKRSKLPEKPVRVPSIQLERKAQVIRDYLSHVAQRPDLSEYARGVAFVQLLKDLLLDAAPQFLADYLEGMEHSLGGPKTALYSQGRVDALYGNLVIEFKRSLPKSLEDAKRQLAKYLSILLSSQEDRHRPLIALATDGVQFAAYAPRFPVEAATLNPEDVSLVEIESGSLDSMTPEAAYYWLDGYFTRQTGPITPRTKQIVDDFGPTSGSFIHAMNVLSGVWKGLENDSEPQVFYDSWQKYLRITYGGPVAETELFLRHTYLATLAKLMVWVRLTGATEPPAEKELRSILNGQYFSQRGIQNFLEEDFFAWVARDAAWPQALTVSRRLLVQLGTYNLRGLSEDVLKGLYERLVDPKDRRDLGEYYTPDWLAARMVERCLGSRPEASVLDPACGSGTFLYQSILFKKDRLGRSSRTLKHIEDNVVGVDIHPLAVIVAKTTYLLGLGGLLEKRGRSIRIPVYLADSIKPPEERMKRRAPGPQDKFDFPSRPYVVSLNGDEADISGDLAVSDPLYDRAVELCAQYAQTTAKAALPSEDQFKNFLRHNEAALARNATWAESLYELLKVLRKKVRERKDTIWAFVLKNVFKPLLLRGRFDVVIGNPPWLTYKDVERGEYQTFIKEEITSIYKLLVGRPQLLTHMELATLFFVRCSELYLRERGMIGFLLPHSIFRADHHDRFRQQQFSVKLALREAWDLEGVKPLFNVAACALFGEKGTEAERSFPGKRVSGNLSVRNASSEEATSAIQAEEKNFRVYQVGSRSVLAPSDEGVRESTRSPYAERFRQGATIFPRSVWFVQPSATSGLGFDSGNPYLRTDVRAERNAQPEYEGVRLEGRVEAEFLYATLLSTDLVPFGHLPFRPVVLPILPHADTYQILSATQARHEGYLGLASWLERAEEVWKERRGEKSERVTIYEWLNYRNKLTAQRARARFRVMYPDMTRILFSSVVDETDLVSRPDGQAARMRGIIVESMLYYYETENGQEGFYLAAFLNSRAVDQLLSTFRRRRQVNVPHIHTKIWEFPIPLFDAGNPDHLKLAELGQSCHRDCALLLASLPRETLVGSLGRLRSLIRDHVKDRISEIDSIVKGILQ